MTRNVPQSPLPTPEMEVCRELVYGSVEQTAQTMVAAKVSHEEKRLARAHNRVTS